MSIATEQKSITHLLKIGRLLSSSCPAASRYYLFNVKQYINDNPSLQTKEIKDQKICDYCGSLWTAETLKVKFQPTPSKNNHIKKLLKLETNQPWRLNSRQKKKLKKFKEATSKIVYTCLSCKKSIKKKGIERKIQNQKASLYTLASNTKHKKSDLNAGLFIASSSQTKPKKNKEVQDTSSELQPSSTLSSYCPTESPSTLHQYKKPDKNKPIRNLYSMPDMSKNINNRKKKKSLLSQILTQEQEAQEKKSSLSAFLVSI